MQRCRSPKNRVVCKRKKTESTIHGFSFVNFIIAKKDIECEETEGINNIFLIITDMRKWKYRKVQNTVKCMKTEGTNTIFGDQRSSQNQREFIVSRHFVRHRPV